MENSGLGSGGLNVGNEQWLGFPQPRYSIFYLWVSSLFRIIRKRLVLGIIFTFSLFYCIANLYLGSHSMMRKDGDSGEDVKIVPSWQREDGKVNFPWRSDDDDVIKQPEPPLDPSGNDTNRHLQEADGRGKNMDAGPRKFPPRSKPITCRNSIQGKALIADDRGYVCKRHEVLPSGCCDTDVETTSRYACDTCLTNHCCEVYENCISCCLDPEKKSILQAILAKASEHQNLLFASVTDHFELCLAKCRTSSESVQHQNLYRNPQAKHCYGTQLPDIQHSP